MSIIFWFALSCLFDNSAACQGGGGGGGGKDWGGGGGGAGGHAGQGGGDGEQTRPPAPPQYVRGDGLNPDYWRPPPGMSKQDIMKNVNAERDRIMKYEQQLQDEDAELDAKMDGPEYDHLSSIEKEELKRKKIRRPKDADEDWPEGWLDEGYTYTGNAPPKYAIVPQGAGKAGICFLPPVAGKCHDYEYRYGYNPNTQQCEKFVWSGCGGNLNNFVQEKRCKEVCVGPTKPICTEGLQGIMESMTNTTDLPIYLNWMEVPTIPTDTNVVYTNKP